MDLARLQEACKVSLHFLCTEILGFKDWDTVHFDIEKFLCRPSQRKLLLVPRDHLKTSIVTKAWTIQNLLKNPNVRALITNQVWAKSKEMLFEIKEFLTTKSDLPKIFGEFQSDRWREDDIVIRQRTKALSAPTIATSGVEAEQTSSHFDIIIHDDLQGQQNYRTPEQRQKVKEYYQSTIALLEPDGFMVVVGTRWHLDDIYAHIIENEATYYDVMVRRVVEDGKLIFPKKFSKKLNRLKKIWEPSLTQVHDYVTYLKESKRSQFYSQYMNNPVDEENQKFKHAFFQYWDRRPERLAISMTVDPAIGLKNENDYTAINVSGMDEGGKIYVLDTLKGRWSPYDAIQAIFTTYLKWQPHTVGLETGGFQKTYQYALEEEMRRRKVFFSIKELKHGSNLSKEMRIEALEPYYRMGMVTHAIWMKGKSLEEELLSFPKGRHDDELDAMASQLEVLVPGDSVPLMDINPHSWQAAFEEARAANQPYKSFFHETIL